MMVQHCKTIHKFKKKQTLRIWGYQLKYVIAMLGLFFSTAVNALSIGHARVESSPQEPLQFSVLIKQVPKDVYEHLSVEIAPPSAWQELGLTPIDGVMNANVQLKEGHSSNTVVARFYGVQPVDEAVIDAIIDIALGNQQQRHQVSMLQQPQPKVHLPTQRKSEHFEYGQQPITPDSQAADIVVQPGDTLHSIAQRIGTDAGTEFQVLAALYEINPKAFSQKNMNFLYAGEVLKRPTEQQIQRLTDQQAREIYLEHLARFNQYKEALARGAVEDEAAEILTMPSAVDDPSESLAKEQPEIKDSDKAAAEESKIIEEDVSLGDRLRLTDTKGQQQNEKAIMADDQKAQEKALAYVEKEITKLESHIDKLSEALEAQSGLDDWGVHWEKLDKQKDPTLISQAPHTQDIPHADEKRLEPALKDSTKNLTEEFDKRLSDNKSSGLNNEKTDVPKTPIEKSAVTKDIESSDTTLESDPAQATEQKQTTESNRLKQEAAKKESRQVDTSAESDPVQATEQKQTTESNRLKQEAAKKESRQADSTAESSSAKKLAQDPLKIINNGNRVDQGGKEQRAVSTGKSSNEGVSTEVDKQAALKGQANNQTPETLTNGTKVDSALSGLLKTQSKKPLPAETDKEIQKKEAAKQSWLQKNFIKIMLALLFFIVVFTIWILRRAQKPIIELESPDRVTPEMIQAKLADINLDLDAPPTDEQNPNRSSS